MITLAATADMKTQENSNLPSPEIGVEIQTRNGRKFTIQIPEREVFRLQSIFAKEEYALPKGLAIPPTLNVVDIGANVGSFALYAEQWAERVNIFCFEPNPQVLKLLYENLKGHENIQIFPFALADFESEIDFYQHPHNTGQASAAIFNSGYNRITVPVRQAESSLSAAGLDSIDVLKIDTEGSEVAILSGLGAYLKKTTIIMLEYHSEDDRRTIDKLLGDFVLYSLDVASIGIGTAKYINKRLLESEQKSNQVIQASCDTIEQLIKNGHWKQADTIAVTTLKKAPKHPRTLYLSALIQQQKGQVAEALRHIELAVDLESRNKHWWSLYAELLKAEGLEDKAKEAQLRSDSL